MKKVKPWTDPNGTPLPDKVLKKVSINWSAETWELYLKNLEVPRRESLIRPHKYDKLREHHSESSVFRGEGYPANLKSKLKDLIETLDSREKDIIEKIFFKYLSEYQVAETLGVSRAVIRKIKKRALRHLKNNLCVRGPICPRVKEEEKLWAFVEGRNEEVEP